MGVNSLPKTVTRQRRGCDLNSGPSAPESSTLTTRLPSHPVSTLTTAKRQYGTRYPCPRAVNTPAYAHANQTRGNAGLGAKSYVYDYTLQINSSVRF